MNEDVLIGKWGSFESKDRNGKVTVTNRSKVSYSFNEDGTGAIKMFFFKVEYTWEVRPEGVAITNKHGNTQMLIEINDKKLAIENEDGSVAYFTKMR